ncbi:hypothetical protein D3C72_1901290 [compost metagenome]
MPPLGAHEYVYVPVPPVTATVADPVAEPLHAIFVCALAVATKAAGSVIVKLWVSVHPFASVTVTVYVPAESPVAVAPVPPLGAQL